MQIHHAQVKPIDWCKLISILVLTPRTSVLIPVEAVPLKPQLAALKTFVENQQRPSSNTREFILETARTLMINQGVSAVTIRGVARAAKMSPGNLGYHFASYDELLHNLMEWVLAPYLQTFAFLRANAEDDPISGLRAVMSYVLDDLGLKDTTMFFPELWVLANRNQRAALYMQELYDTYMQVLEDIVAAARPDLSREAHQQLALFICTSIEGQTVFVGFERPYAKHQQALKQITMDAMISAVVNHQGNAQLTIEH